MRAMISSSLAALSVVSAHVARAQEGASARLPAATMAAIGQVNVVHHNRRTTCTGTLVAPNVVLTAAECVVDPTTREPVMASKVHFLASVDRDRHGAHAKAECVMFGADYVYGGPARHLPRVPQGVGAAAFAHSAALLVLERRLDATPVRLAQAGDLVAGASYLVPGYGSTQRYRVATRACTFTRTGERNLWAGTCDTAGQGHGAPILTRMDGEMRVVGLTPAGFDAERPLGVTFDLRAQFHVGDVDAVTCGSAAGTRP